MIPACRTHRRRRTAGASLRAAAPALALAAALMTSACGGGLGASSVAAAQRSAVAAPAPTRSTAAVAAAAATPETQPTTASIAAVSETLVWQDEFDTPGLPNASRWAYDTYRNAAGWWNDEKQYYSGPRAKNARVENGVLVIEAHRETLDKAAFPDWGGQAYTSSRLITLQRASWRYGRFEVRAKLPCGRGTWPAIWLLADPPGTWPDDGEIDILEHVGFDPGVLHATVHTKANNHTLRNAKTGRQTLPDACTAFHRYQLRWTPTQIEIGVDDVPTMTYANDGAGNRATWPFDRPMHLILNVAVGGAWGGQQGIDDAAFPQRMEVDYVRVYDR